MTASSMTLFSYAQWQLFGGSSLLQSLANDANLGMWIDTQVAANTSKTTFYTDVIAKYYDYDGYVLMMDAGIKTTAANDKIIACV